MSEAMGLEPSTLTKALESALKLWRVVMTAVSCANVLWGQMPIAATTKAIDAAKVEIDRLTNIVMMFHSLEAEDNQWTV